MTDGLLVKPYISTNLKTVCWCAQWSVLQCGHSFCLNCITLLLQRPQTFAFVACLKCPMCRHVTQTADISYVIATNKDTSVTDIKVNNVALSW